MRVEFIGIAGTADRSETIAETGPAVQPEYLYHLAATHEQSGFDRVLVAHGEGIRQRIAQVRASAEAAAAASTGSRSACAPSPPTPKTPPGNGPARSSR